MSESLTIENFGPIKKMSFDFKKINILIGEQGSGKSTVAKLISAINKMATGETLTSGHAGLMRKDEYGELSHFKRHLKIYGIENYLNELSVILYKHPLFDFKYRNGSSIISKTNEKVSEEALDLLSITFIPADRAAVNLFTNEVLFGLNEINQDLPGYFVRFAQLFNRLKKTKDKFDFSDTLGLKYKFENGQDKIEITNGKLINISDASSAVQTNVPLLVILEHQSQSNDSNEFYSSDLNITVIEEPELNCFPNLQNAILKKIIENTRPKSNIYKRRTIITTHSPYILTSLNNLMFAFVTEKNDKSEVEKIIDKNYWVNPEDVSAYLLSNDKGGSVCENIMDEELKQIKVEKIDEISEVLSTQWHQLADLNFDK